MYCYLAVSLTVVLKVSLVIIEFLLLWATRRQRENTVFVGEGVLGWLWIDGNGVGSSFVGDGNGLLILLWAMRLWRGICR